MPLGLYVSVPFCRSKCSYCNFASDVFSQTVHQRYVDRLCESIERAANVAEQIGGQFERSVDSVFIGGGTPTVLDIGHLQRIFVTIRSTFDLSGNAEITVECAPGTLTHAIIGAFQKLGVNRVSLGVQSFVDQEAASVGRLHRCETVMDDVSRLKAAGIDNINVDLIAGLPHQTLESWRSSLEQVVVAAIPHISVYMLEVDEDSRLGRELIAGGTKYHAHFVPDEDLVADFYEVACQKFNDAGIRHYEISNFARNGFQSQHNLKYWTRQPYFGFGVDAHSMLLADKPEIDAAGKDTTCTSPVCPKTAVRFFTSDSLDEFIAGRSPVVTPVSPEAALEEAFFLGLRLNHGVDLRVLGQSFGEFALARMMGMVEDCIQDGLMESLNQVIRLTSKGRLLSNEVFQRFISVHT